MRQQSETAYEKETTDFNSNRHICIVLVLLRERESQDLHLQDRDLDGALQLLQLRNRHFQLQLFRHIRRCKRQGLLFKP